MPDSFTSPFDGGDDLRGLSADLRAIDRLLARAVALEPLRSGLAGRVFTGSVGFLAGGRTVITARSGPGVVRRPVGRVASRLRLGSGIALAAAIMLAFIIGIRAGEGPSLLVAIPVADAPQEWEYDVADAEALIGLTDMRFSDIEQELEALEEWDVLVRRQ